MDNSGQEKCITNNIFGYSPLIIVHALNEVAVIQAKHSWRPDDDPIDSASVLAFLTKLSAGLKFRKQILFQTRILLARPKCAEVF